jgi:hypothetical protein
MFFMANFLIYKQYEKRGGYTRGAGKKLGMRNEE